LSFLNPILLFGAAAVAVPILIHLLNQRKVERVTWAAMRFLQAAVERNKRRLRVEDLVLLLIRCATIALLALALARPALPGAAGGMFGRGGVAAVVLLDNSGSMGLSDGVATRFDNAKTAAEQAIEALPSGSSAAVLLASDGVAALVAEPTLDLNLARKSVREAKLSDRGTDLLPAVRRAVETLRRKPSGGRELYLVTDGQAVGWRQLEEVRTLLADAKGEVRAHVVLVGPPESGANNLAVTGLSIDGGLVTVERPVRVEATVANFGLADAANVRVTLSVNGEPASDEATIDAIPVGGSRSVPLFARFRAAGTAAVTASIEHDRLPRDDARTLAVRAFDRMNVLLVDGSPGKTGRESETFFLQNALVPVPARQAERHFVRTSTIAPTELATVRLDEYDVVVLANVADAAPRAVDALVEYVRNGGGLIAFPGDNAEATAPTFYSQRLVAERHLLPASLGAARGRAGDVAAATSLAAANVDHPIAATWRGETSGTLTAARFYRAFTLEPDPAGAVGDAGAPRVVLRFADGSPAAMERSFGAGRTILFASGPTTAWNDLPVRPGVFIPLMYRSVGAIVARQGESLTVRSGAPIVYRAPLDWVGRDATMTPPNAGPSDATAKDTRRVDLVGDRAVVKFDNTDVAGAYAVDVADQTLRFAAQPDPIESDLRGLSPQQEQQLVEAAQVMRWEPGDSLASGVRQARVGTELWLPIALLVLALAAMEPFLAHWFGRPK